MFTFDNYRKYTATIDPMVLNVVMAFMTTSYRNYKHLTTLKHFCEMSRSDWLQVYAPLASSSSL